MTISGNTVPPYSLASSSGSTTSEEEAGMDWEKDRNGMIGGETVKRNLLTVSGSPTTENLSK